MDKEVKDYYEMEDYLNREPRSGEWKSTCSSYTLRCKRYTTVAKEFEAVMASDAREASILYSVLYHNVESQYRELNRYNKHAPMFKDIEELCNVSDVFDKFVNNIVIMRENKSKAKNELNTGEKAVKKYYKRRQAMRG